MAPMIHPGLCSLTLAALSPAEIVSHCKQAGLTHIEWWGKAHVPMGDVETAATVGELTRTAGLQISTYGSYYRVGSSEANDLSFDDVLRTALALEAPAIRVWAGTQGSAACSAAQRELVVSETHRIAALCADAGINLVFEYHGGTLTDSTASAAAFADAVPHPAVSLGWQSRPDWSLSENLEGLRGMLPRLATIHVFNWSMTPEGKIARHPLGDAMETWRRYFGILSETGRDYVALLEFVPDNSVEQFREDARTLMGLVCK